MDKWLTEKDIVDNNSISAFDLADAVEKGLITIYDYELRQPIIIEKYKKLATDIRNLLEKIPAEQIETEGVINYTPWPYLFEYLNELIPVIQHYQQKKEHPDYQYQNASPDEKLDIITNYRPIEKITREHKLKINEAQLLILKKPIYSILHVQLLIKSNRVIFKESEIKAQLEAGNDHIQTEINDSPQQNKEKKNLLKIIGALIEINYLHKSKGEPNPTYTKETGKPNISQIINRIFQQLALNNFSDEGMKQKTLQDKIPLALAEIEHNKISQ